MFGQFLSWEIAQTIPSLREHRRVPLYERSWFHGKVNSDFSPKATDLEGRVKRVDSLEWNWWSDGSERPLRHRMR